MTMHADVVHCKYKSVFGKEVTDGIAIDFAPISVLLVYKEINIYNFGRMRACGIVTGELIR